MNQGFPQTSSKMKEHHMQKIKHSITNKIHKHNPNHISDSIRNCYINPKQKAETSTKYHKFDMHKQKTTL